MPFKNKSDYDAWTMKNASKIQKQTYNRVEKFRANMRACRMYWNMLLSYTAKRDQIKTDLLKGSTDEMIMKAFDLELKAFSS